MRTKPTTRAKRPQRFAAGDRELAGWAKALGHPARLAILRFLATQDQCFCGQIVDVLPLAQSTVSQHLRELKDAGIIRGTVDGVKVCYCLNPAVLQKLRAAVGSFLDGLAGSDSCGECAC
jgi:ArsR family transcriptional regulator